MRFFASLATLSLAAVHAAVHQVAVGEGGLMYTPNTTYANVGDTIVFSFYPINHDVVQGPYETPCMSGNNTGIYSGFIPSAAGVANRTFQVTINNTNPIWFYCSQKGAGGHCSRGMAGVINPPNSTQMTLTNYVAAAANVANTSYTQPNAAQFGVVVANTSANTNTTPTTASTSSASSAAATSTKNAAATAGAAKWGVGAVAGGLALAFL